MELGKANTSIRDGLNRVREDFEVGRLRQHRKPACSYCENDRAERDIEVVAASIHYAKRERVLLRSTSPDFSRSVYIRVSHANFDADLESHFTFPPALEDVARGQYEYSCGRLLIAEQNFFIDRDIVIHPSIANDVSNVSIYEKRIALVDLRK